MYVVAYRFAIIAAYRDLKSLILAFSIVWYQRMHFVCLSAVTVNIIPITSAHYGRKSFIGESPILWRHVTV